MEDRRRFPRYDCAYEVRYSTQGNAEIESHTVSKNISRVGIRMPVTRIVKPGDRLKLDIDANDKRGRITIEAKVVWTKAIRRPAPLQLDAGLEFLKVKPNDAERLLQQVY